MRRQDMIQKLRRTLIQRRDALRRTLASCESLLSVSNRPVGDTIDAAIDTEQDELDSQLAAAENRELAAINDALQRFREGAYGTCSGCQRAIPLARLEALPYATLCIKCQAEAEQQNASRATRPDRFGEVRDRWSSQLEMGTGRAE